MLFMILETRIVQNQLLLIVGFITFLHNCNIDTAAIGTCISRITSPHFITIICHHHYYHWWSARDSDRSRWCTIATVAMVAVYPSWSPLPHFELLHSTLSLTWYSLTSNIVTIFQSLFYCSNNRIGRIKFGFKYCRLGTEGITIFPPYLLIWK